MKRAPLAQAGREHARQFRIGAQDFFVPSVAKCADPQRFLGGRIGGSDRTRGIHEQKSGGHIASYFFGESLGFLGSFLRDEMEARQFFFLRPELFDYALHRSGHESRSVLGIGSRSRKFRIGRSGILAKVFANENCEKQQDQQENREAACQEAEVERLSAEGMRRKLRHHLALQCLRSESCINAPPAATDTNLPLGSRKIPPAEQPFPEMCRTEARNPSLCAGRQSRRCPARFPGLTRQKL